MAQHSPQKISHKRCGSSTRGYYASEAGSSPIRPPTKQLRLDIGGRCKSEKIHPETLPTSDTEDDTGSPTTPTLLQRVGLDHRNASSNIKDKLADTTVVPSQIENGAEDLALELGLKVQKRDRQLDVAKGRISKLNEWLEEAVEREHILRAEIRGLKSQEANWRRASDVVKTVLDSAEAFRG